MNLIAEDEAGSHQMAAAGHGIAGPRNRNDGASRVAEDADVMVGVRRGREVAHEDHVAVVVKNRGEGLPEDPAASQG